VSGAEPRRVLMTLDAVGGVWRYALDLVRGFAPAGVEFVLVGLGPEPGPAQRLEAAALPNARLEWLDEPLDWMAAGAEALAPLPTRLAGLAERFDVDLLHLNLPSQAGGLRRALPAQRPVVVVSHSCVVTWWAAVKRTPLPPEWRWQKRLNRAGFDAADAVLAPSRSHATELERAYGRIERLRVVPNAHPDAALGGIRQRFVFAAGRWWDEGKNAATLDAAAGLAAWPVVMAGACEGAGGRAVLRNAEARGALPHVEVQRLMALAGVVVSPSLYEPFGLVALEAARTGAPLVLADIPTYRELWEDAALFAAPRDPRAFAGAIELLAAAPGLRAEFGLRAARRAEAFSMRAQAAAVRAAWRAAAEHAVAPSRAGVA
jgi:glycosyltransferase involved in cell wall biosynthesis